MKKIKKGYYKHYKGGIAKVIGEAKNSEAGEKETGENILWVRPKKMFFEIIKEKGEEKVRFEYITNQREKTEVM